MNLQIARLATIKSPERTLASGVMEHEGDSQYGKVIYVIDVPLPLTVGEQVERAIVSAIQDEYFGVERKNPLYQFEDCVKQINLALAELAESGHTDWVGHVHACIALWSGDELYVTHAGKVLGLVARSGTLVSFIDSGSSERRVMVHKTFANLTSGQLHQGDTIIIGNGEILRHFSPQFLAQAATLTPVDCVRDMQSAGRRLNLRYITAIVGQVGQGDDEIVPVASVLLSSDDESTMPDQQTGHRYSKTNLFNQINNQIMALVDIAIHNAKKLLPTKPSISYEDQDKIDGPSNDAETPPPASIAPPILERPATQKIIHQVERVRRLAIKYIRQLSSMLRHIPPRVLLFIGLACVILVVGNGLTQNKTKNVNKPSKNQLTELINQTNAKLDKASAEATEKPDVARNELISAQTLIDQIMAGDDVVEAQNLQERYTKLIETLNNVVVLKPVSDNPINSQTTYIAIIGQYLFSVRASGPDLYRQTLGKNEAAQTIYTLNKGTVSYMSLVDDEKRLILASTKRQLWRIDIDNQTTATELIAPLGESWPEVASITTYQDNLYILEQGTGAIWKYSSRDRINYSTKTAYLADSSLNNPNFVAIATDGFIYTLSNDGTVSKLLKGTPQIFGPVTVPKPGNTFQNAAHLYISTSLTSLFIQDAHRLVQISKDGQYLRQYVLNDVTINTSFVSPKTKRAWFVVGDKLIETSL